jgi:hypothetical protein
MINPNDQVLLFRLCMTCGGQKTYTDETGNTVQCDKCNEKGRIEVGVDLRSFADYMGQEITNIVRLKTGLR